MKRSIALVLASLLCACSAAKPPEIENVPLPSGMTVKVIGIGVAPAFRGAKTLGLRYQSDVNPDDAAALGDEALKVWRFFRFQAEGKGFTSAVLTAQAQGKSADVHFERIGGVWSQVDANGKAIGATARPLTGAMSPFRWMIGTWRCDFTFAADKFKAHHPTIIIDETDPTGTMVDQTYAESWGPGAALGESSLGYNPIRKVWYRRGRQAPNAVENDEARGAYSRDMTFSGFVQAANKPPIEIRKRFVLDPAGTSSHVTTQAKIGDQWVSVGRGTCEKSPP